MPEEKGDSLKSSGANRPYKAITVKVKFGGTAARLFVDVKVFEHVDRLADAALSVNSHFSHYHISCSLSLGRGIVPPAWQLPLQD